MSEVLAWIIFLSLSLVAIVTAAGMLLTMSMYRAGLALMASFVALAGLFILLGADLLAAIQIMMNVGGMLVMVLFMVMMMMDPGGEMMWAMKRDMHLPGPGAFSMHMPWSKPLEEEPPQQQEGQATEWTCPMHPEVSQPGPGTCPKCGMSLIPRAEVTDEHSSQELVSQEQVYSCPMHPEVQQAHPGTCPKCSTPLVPVEIPQSTQTQVSQTTMYTCPMHPEIQQTQPGKCPKCGMTLIPAEQSMSSHEPVGQPGMSMEHSATSDHTMHVEVEGEENGTGSSGQADGIHMHHTALNDNADTMQMPGHEMHMSGMGHSNHEMTTPGMAESHEMGQMASQTMEMSHEMNMSGMTPGQHYQMMVDMAMSTAQLPWAIILGVLSAILLIVLVVLTPWPLAHTGPTQDATTAVGELLLSRYMIGFEGAAFLILAGIAGAVIFAQRARRLGQEQLEHEVPVASEASGQVYSCPMHPEVRESQLGTCPKCSMLLVPVEQTPGARGESEAHGSHEEQRDQGEHGGHV
jgi:NADH:ubiquinone oxidoreductase subunit 6 (subunit J)/DNA-directed RNA polymerase subunit M/transcription elongation factor TFIIS